MIVSKPLLALLMVVAFIAGAISTVVFTSTHHTLIQTVFHRMPVEGAGDIFKRFPACKPVAPESNVVCAYAEGDQIDVVLPERK